MPLPVFENSYFLQSLGWAIGNSLWQTSTLWLLYNCIITADKKLSAEVKHHLGFVLLNSSFAWFLFTIFQNYQLLTGNSTRGNLIFTGGVALALQPFTYFLPLLSIVYLLVLCFYTAGFIKKLSDTHELQTGGLIKVPIDFRLFTTRTAIHLGIKKKVKVWLSANVAVPCVTGLLKPIILLPVAIINHLSTSQLEAILLHELAHIKRNDYLLNFLQSVIELVLFFNPFALFLSKAIKKERENCCDNWVMNFQYDNYEYARALLVLEEQRNRLQFGFALGATNGKKNLLGRIKRLFDNYPRTDFSYLQKFKLAGLSIILLMSMLVILPYMVTKVSHHKDITIKNELITPVKIDKVSENSAKNVLAITGGNALVATAPIVNKIKFKAKRSAVKKQTTDYVNTFINEELLSAADLLQPITASEVTDSDTINTSKLLVKIEEQQSGNTQTNTYYFELNNRNGTASIKPLIILNKFKVPIKVRLLKNLRDSLGKLIKPAGKKRITS